ncbi:MAG: glycosyltransferase [Steroidobacteraceae bacterium]
MTFVFWFSVAAILYAYFGYAVVIWTAAALFGKDCARRPDSISVSIIVTAYNEGTNIQRKIENLLATNYARGPIEYICVSDGSTDNTAEILRRYESSVLRVIVNTDRRGKESCQKQAIDASNGEVLVFTDVGTTFESSAIGTLVENFADTSVGCVSSTDKVLTSNGEIDGEGLYVKYEMWLRTLESRLGSLIGLSGSFFAIRKILCDNWATDRDSDFLAAANTVQRGMRAIADPRTIGYYRSLESPKAEYARKVRTVARGMRAFFRNISAINPLTHGRFALQLLQHKLLRWLVPIFMITALVSNAALVAQSETNYALPLFVLQVGFYAAATFGGGLSNRRAFAALRIAAFFVTANVAILTAWYRFLTGAEFTTWQPSRRA